MKSMVEVAKDSAVRPQVVTATVELIDSEVSSKRGLSGSAIKLGYKAVKGLKGGQMIPDVVNGLLDEFSAAIEPIHKKYRDSGETAGFDRFLAQNEGEAVQGLLKVTDDRAEKTKHGVLRSSYNKLRPMAEKQVAAALPGVGKLVDRFCA